MTICLFVTAFIVANATMAARSDDDNPFKNVKVGDYAIYKLSTKQDIEGTVTQAVTAKSDRQVTIKITSKVTFKGQDANIPEQEYKIDLTKPFDPTKVGGTLPAGTDAKFEKVEDGKEKIKIGGKQYDTTWTTYKVKTKAMDRDVESDVKLWMAKGAPMGMVKMTMDAVVASEKVDLMMELIESGNKK